MILVKSNSATSGDFLSPVIAQFPNGEKKYKIPVSSKTEVIQVSMFYEDDSEFFDLLCTVDSLRRNNPFAAIVLNLPYIPYSGMDRIENETDSFSLKSFANFINKTIKPHAIRCLDAHSDVSLGIFDAWTSNSIPQIRMVKENFKPEDTLLIFPDATATKRYKKHFKDYKSVSINKERDFDTGKLISATLVNSSNIEDKFLWNVKNVVIVDDICSKGGTFALASELISDNIGHNDYKIHLAVAHCEASIFEGILLTDESLFNGNVYCTNSMPKLIKAIEAAKETNPVAASRIIITNF